MNDFFMLSFVIILMIMSPGPDFAVVVKNSLSHGRMSGVGAAFGIAAANLCHITINLLGIGLLIAESVMAFKIMQIVGAAYLMYLGYKGIRAQPAPQANNVENSIVVEQAKKPHGYYAGFRMGCMTSLLNPKSCLFFLSFFSVIISPESTLLTKILYGLWMSSLALVWFTMVSLFFTSPAIGRPMQRYKHWLERMTGLVLIALALKLVMSDLRQGLS
jgi:RhtB (resistance to homoserine/threonine) family protein